MCICYRERLVTLTIAVLGIGPEIRQAKERDIIAA